MLKHSKIIITLLMVLPLAVTVAALFFLPDEMPAHYNVQGEVDRWGSKYEMLLFPFFIPVFGLGMSAAAHVASHGAGANESTTKAIVCANIAVLAMFDVMGLYFLINSALVAGGRDGLRVDISNVMCIAMGVVFIPTGLYMPKLKRNALSGVRTKWSMKNDAAWAASQRFGGAAFIAAGVIDILVGIFVPGIYSILTGLGVLLLAGVAMAVYSRRAYEKTQGGEGK